MALRLGEGKHAAIEHTMTTTRRSSPDVPPTNDRRPRVLHVIDSLSISGGAERQLVANLNSFDHSTIEHHVAILRTSEDSRAGDLPPAVRVRTLGNEGDDLSRIRAAMKLIRLIRADGIDLVHASLANATMAARLAGMVTGTPILESLVNISHEDIRTVDNPSVTTWKLRFHIIIDRLTTWRVTRFHAVSQAVAESWAKVIKIDPARIDVIPRGIDLPALHARLGEEETRVTVRKEFDMPADAFVVVTVGREEPQKGHRYLIEAAAAARPALPAARYLIVGRRGNASPAIERLIAELAVDDIVIRAGSRRDIPRLLAAADVFAFPSLFEGNGGNALIEAMAMGLPVITTGAPPMTDLVPNDEFGILVPLMDPDALAAALVRLHSSDELRSTLGEAAKSRSRTFLTPAAAADVYEALYRKMLAS